MKNRLYITVALLTGCLISFSGCKKFLDEKTDKKLAVPTTLGDFQALMDNTTKINYSGPVAAELSADSYEVSEAIWAGLTAEEERRIYTWEKDHLFAEGFNSWKSLYDAVYYCNTVLSGMDKVSRNEANAVQWDNIKGQALFCRGNNYLDAAIVWCLAYDQGTAGSDLGLPLRFSTDFNAVSVRSNLQQTYESVIRDLKAAVNLLPVTPLNKFRPSRAAAYGLLARTYLSMRDYENANKYAELCLSLHPDVLDFNTLVPTARSPLTLANNTEVIYVRSTGYTEIMDVSNASISQEIYDSFNAADWRKKIFFKMRPDNTYWFSGDYVENLNTFTGLATDEMILIKAEFLARNGRIAESMSALNGLIAKRWNKKEVYVPYTAGESSEALKIVLLERKKELMFRGLRWMDIKRLNKEGANITLTRKLNNKVYQLLPNDLRYALPIPEDVIALSGMVQNRR